MKLCWKVRIYTLTKEYFDQIWKALLYNLILLKKGLHVLYKWKQRCSEVHGDFDLRITCLSVHSVQAILIDIITADHFTIKFKRMCLVATYMYAGIWKQLMRNIMHSAHKSVRNYVQHLLHYHALHNVHFHEQYNLPCHVHNYVQVIKHV